MSIGEPRRAAGLAYREAGPQPADGRAPVALLLHGYPNSSYMWRDVMPALAEAGYRAIAPDLAGFGDSPADLPGTWERHVDAVERFRSELGLEGVALVVHDWGGLIGLRWACDHPAAVSALVISNTGFFADGRWHGIAEMMRTEGQGEELMANMSRDLFAAALRQSSPGMPDEAVDEYWKCCADDERKQAQLDLYRSGDFSKLEPYEGCLGSLALPTLILWGEKDDFAPVGGAHRFAKQIPDARVVVLPEAGHFPTEDDPERTATEIGAFLAGLLRGGAVSAGP